MGGKTELAFGLYRTKKFTSFESLAVSESLGKCLTREKNFKLVELGGDEGPLEGAEQGLDGLAGRLLVLAVWCHLSDHVSAARVLGGLHGSGEVVPRDGLGAGALHHLVHHRRLHDAHLHGRDDLRNVAGGEGLRPAAALDPAPRIAKGVKGMLQGVAQTFHREGVAWRSWWRRGCRLGWCHRLCRWWGHLNLGRWWGVWRPPFRSVWRRVETAFINGKKAHHAP
mmetsp:Transcript_18314/g.37973  ORF Transcript_18314/g.37973 Transcript_18314/m.37973 type:complete len:225 (+) Transcript_18314:2384-3058(+)